MNVTPGVFLLSAFVLITAIQLFYYLFFFSRLAFHREKSLPGPIAELPISVVICARNEEANLRRNLPVVLQQKYTNLEGVPAYEVIVVDDNSEDESRHFLRFLEPGYPHYRHIDLVQEAKLIPGKKYPLSVGLRGAVHDTVVLTDADCKPVSTHWLSLMSSGFGAGREIVLGYSPYFRKPGLLNRVIRFDTLFHAQLYLSFALAGIPYMGVGRNLAYRKDLFFKHKGFLAHQKVLSGDDDLFINAAATSRNTSVVIDPRAFTYSEPKRSWGSWFRQKSRHLSTARHYKPLHKFLLGLFSISHFLFYAAFVIALIFSPYRYFILAVFGCRFLVQGILFFRISRRLQESDLFPWFWLFDAMMVLYYLVFGTLIYRKPPKRWK